MVKWIRESDNCGKSEITFAYDSSNQEDVEIIKKFDELCSTQKRCDNCTNFYYDGFMEYQSCNCKIHGYLEEWNHPHHDMDGSKCEDYKRKLKTEGE